MVPKLPKLSLSSLGFAIALGVIVAVMLFLAQIKGLLPNQVKEVFPKNHETRTIIQEENAVISVVEKTSSSEVAIGVSQRVINPCDPFSS